MNERELLALRAVELDKATALHTSAEAENRNFTADEQAAYDKAMAKVSDFDARIERAKKIEAAPIKPGQAPAHLKHARGDNFTSAFGAYVRNNDTGGVREWLGNEGVEIRASNNTDMNIGTAADGGDVVPVGFYNQIIARRMEASLPEKLGVRRIPGVGTTVDVPYDNEADGEFITKGEATAFDQDAPAVAKASMTLVKYTKYITLSDELLQDNDVNLLNFLADWVARGQAKTMNNLLLTEVATSGTSFKTTASATAIAQGELEPVVLNDTVGDYLDDGGNVAWVMKASTYSSIASISASTVRVYGGLQAPGAAINPANLLGYPVHFSTKAGALTAAQKSAYFGNWNYVGWREAPGLTILRDPYSAASSGQVKLWMYFRTVFKQLQAGAVGYLIQAT
jgi:HK97 family phage major capsid protein